MSVRRFEIIAGLHGSGCDCQECKLLEMWQPLEFLKDDVKPIVGDQFLVPEGGNHPFSISSNAIMIYTGDNEWYVLDREGWCPMNQSGSPELIDFRGWVRL